MITTKAESSVTHDQSFHKVQMVIAIKYTLNSLQQKAINLTLARASVKLMAFCCKLFSVYFIAITDLHFAINLTVNTSSGHYNI